MVEKIRKLLALAEGSTGPEAELALAMATSLLAKYNISIRDIDGKPFSFNQHNQNNMFETLVEMPTGFGAAEYWASCVIRDHFFVSVIVNRPKQNSDAGPCNLLILGEKHNVEIAWYVFKFIQQKFTQLWSEYAQVTSCPKTHFESFVSGLFFGLDAKLKAKVAIEYPNSKALIAIGNELKSLSLKLINSNRVQGLTSNDVSGYDSKTMSDGKKIGKTIEIFPAVGSHNTQPLKQVA